MPNNSGIPLSVHNRARLRGARLSANWTMDELATEADISESQVSRIESGESNPSLATLEAICAALGLLVDVSTRVVIKKGKVNGH